MRSVRIVIILSVLALCALAYISTQLPRDIMVSKTALLMGTIVEIKVPVFGGLPRNGVEETIGKAFDEIRRVENLFSVYDEDSEISRINRLGKGRAFKASNEVFDLIEKSVGYWRISDGAFDITVKPLVDLWSLAKKTGVLPSEGDIKASHARIGSGDILLDRTAGTIAFAKEGMAIDLGGIAKGYATDRAVAVLREAGIDNAIVNCGGDMFCLGKRSQHQQWRVGIRHPRDREKLALELDLENRAIDTSGDYEKYFKINGKRYSHIIDPRTGYPTGDHVVSASIIADTSLEADALATAACVLGSDAGRMLSNAKGVDAIIIAARNGGFTITMTESVKERYHAREAD